MLARFECNMAFKSVNWSIVPCVQMALSIHVKNELIMLLLEGFRSCSFCVKHSQDLDSLFFCATWQVPSILFATASKEVDLIS